MPTHIISMFDRGNYNNNNHTHTHTHNHNDIHNHNYNDTHNHNYNSNNNCSNNCSNNIIKDAENRILETEKRILQTEKRINRQESRMLHIVRFNYKNKNDEKKYCRLINNKDVQKIVGWYYEFSLGKIDKLNEQLTMDEYNRLTVVLYELSEKNMKKKMKCKKYYSDSDSDTDSSYMNSDSDSSYDSTSKSSKCANKKKEKISCYEKFRINIVRSLETLMKAVEINNDLNTYKKTLESNSDAINAYNNIKALYDRYNYLKEMQKSAMNLFDDINVSAPVLKLKPEYAEYIKKYGFPEGGIFESDKMAEILEKLGNGDNGDNVDNGDNCDNGDNVSLKSESESSGSHSHSSIHSGSSSGIHSGSHSGSSSGNSNVKKCK